jgi:hypothetical protein
MQSLDTGGTSRESSTPNRFCTRAATGRCPIFQEIYVCRTCRSADKEATDFPLCICSACADGCHENHEVEYVGMGPCFCDCRDGSCRIADASVQEAARIGLETTVDSDCPCPSLSIPSIKRTHENEESSCPTYIRDVYHIPLLRNDAAFQNRLVRQAKELIRHSRDTFWLDAVEKDAKRNEESLCDLELLAWQVFHRHWKHYCDIPDRGKDPPMILGAEWWVQVKPVSSASDEEKVADALESDHLQEEAIDLHYDKDEEMAASFGLGVFPSLSTVTYLTDSSAAPTLIFSRRYDSNEEETMSDMLISHPSCGKHVVFDGRLLHGAPSHPLLRRHNVKGDGEETREPAVRITFLVNMWLNYKPARVNPLSQSIRECIKKVTNDTESSRTFSSAGKALDFVPVESMPTLALSSLVDRPEMLREPIELPFVGGKSTWAGDGDDDDLAMVVKVYPPPLAHSQHDSVLVQFGPGLEATLDYFDADDAV